MPIRKWISSSLDEVWARWCFRRHARRRSRRRCLPVWLFFPKLQWWNALVPESARTCQYYFASFPASAPLARPGVVRRLRSTTGSMHAQRCGVGQDRSLITRRDNICFSEDDYGLGGGVGRGLGVGANLGVGVGLGVAVAVGVDVGVDVAVGVAVGVAVTVAVAVGVVVAVGVTVAVAVGDAVGVGVGVPPPVGNTRT